MNNKIYIVEVYLWEYDPIADDYVECNTYIIRAFSNKDSAKKLSNDHDAIKDILRKEIENETESGIKIIFADNLSQPSVFNYVESWYYYFNDNDIRIVEHDLYE